MARDETQDSASAAPGLPHGMTPSAVRGQLERILASDEFQATDKMRAFLRYVVDETLAGRSDRIKGFTIAVTVFGRGEDFDAVSDPVVRIQAGRLRRALERYYLVAGDDDPIRIDIPKGRYVPRFAAGVPQVDRPAAGPREVANGFRSPHSGMSVVVLPFENLATDSDQLPLALGLTEELVTELTRFQDITVVPCQKAQRPPDFPADPVAMARAVDARFVLQGSVRRDPRTVKVAAHLTDTVDGEEVWSESFSHPLDASRLIETQETIASSVVAAVAGEFGIIARRLAAESRKKAPADLRTYEAMLCYYQHQVDPAPESAEPCFAALQAAAEREPEYGPVWSALATLHCQMYVFDAPGFDGEPATALAHARRGAALEPGSQLARLILAYASHLADHDEAFEEEGQVALALNPNSPHTIGSLGYLHALRGQFDVGIPLLERAMALNPCHPIWFHSGRIFQQLLAGDREQALTGALRCRPFISFWDDALIAGIFGSLGRAAEAAPHVEAALAVKPDLPPRARELLERSLKCEPLVDELIAGMRAVGLAH